MKKLFTLLLIILFTVKLFAQKNEDAVISLTGIAKQYILPDLATIKLTIKAEDQDETKTFRKVQEITRSVFSKTVNFGFKKDQIKLTDFSLDEKYTHKKNEGRIKVGYIGQQTVRIKTPIDTETISRFLEYISKNKFENTSISFITELSPELEEKTRLQLIQKALQNAKIKADLMARTTGLTITGIVKIGYNVDESIFEIADSVIKRDEEIPDEHSLESTITSFLSIEEIEVTESISVIYRIRNSH